MVRARVAVIVPAYNVVAFIRQSISSILSQTFADFVLVAVNDGSTDGTGEVLRSIVDDRLIVIDQENSGGPSRPRNVGIAATDCEFVALFDADDLMNRDKLAESIRVLEACPRAAFVFSDFGVIDEQDLVLTDSLLRDYPEFQAMLASLTPDDGFVYVPPEALYRTLCSENFFGTSSVTIRRSVLDIVGGFDESLRNSDDRDMWFRLARQFGGAYIPKALHLYRDRPGSISNRGGRTNATHRIEVLQRQLKTGIKGRARRELRLKIAENHATIGYAYRRSGRRWASVRAFLRALVMAPRLRWLLALGNSALTPKYRKPRSGR